MHYIACLTTSFLTVLALSVQAHAVTIDFDEVPSSAPVFTNSYSEKDYTVAASSDGFVIFSSQLQTTVGFTILADHENPFELQSFRAFDHNPPAGWTWTLEGFFAAGGSITQVLNISESPFLPTYSLTGFEGLSSVTFTPDAPVSDTIYAQTVFDEFVLDHVPEPSSLALLGLGGIALLRYRR